MTNKMMLINRSFVRAVLVSLLLFILFCPLFLVKTKVFILQGQIQVTAPIDMTFYILPSAEHKTLKTLFHKRIEHSGYFEIEMRENKLFGLQIGMQSQSDRVRLSDLVLIGSKKIPLSFKDAVFNRVTDKNMTNDFRQVDLSVNPIYSSIEFNDVSLPQAKRVYHLTPLVCLLFFPILWSLWKSPKKHKCGQFLFLFVPLFLLAIIKYYAFEHSYTLYYQKVSLSNLWHLECYEFMVFSLVYLLLAGAVAFRRWLKILCVSLLVLLFVILTIDGVIFHNLNARFIFAEATHYGSEYATAFHMFVSYLGTIQGRLMLLCCLSIWGIVHYYDLFSLRVYKVTLLSVAVFFAISMFLFKNNFLFDYAFYNVFEANQGTQQKKPYSENFAHNLHETFHLDQTCFKGLNKRRNVIVIIAESLSTFASQKLSGLHNYMPRLDKLIDQYAVYSSYYSNSYNTNGGIFSLISGLPAIHGFEGLSSGNNKSFYDNSLAQKLKKSGYNTYFLTAVEPNEPLAEIMYQSHFDVVADYQDPYYQDKPKLVFNAVADEYLFANVLQRIEAYRGKNPYLMVVSTISGHGPYIHPKTKETSFEKTTGYVDEEIGKFVAALHSRGFFENGMVLITGDHRAMLPVGAEESEQLSPLAEGRVPLVVLDKDIKGTQNGIYSHNDVASSLQYYLTEEGCFNDFQRNLFAETSQERCLLYQKLSPRDKVVILCADGQSVICLNGDDTGYCEGNGSQKYVDFVNWLRI